MKHWIIKIKRKYILVNIRQFRLFFLFFIFSYLLLMYTKKILFEGITREFEVLKHLGSKVDKKNASFRLTEGQRSTEELEHYIISSFPAQIQAMVNWNRDQAVYMNYVNQFDGFTFKKFGVQLNKALRLIKKEIRSVKGKSWKEEIEIWGRKGSRASFLIDYVFAFLGAYKMQLFLQLKAAGLSDLSTYNLWAGKDAPAK